MSKSLDEQIEDVFRKYQKSLSSSTISVLLNKDIRRVEKRLESMHRFRRIKPITAKKVRFWKLNSE